MDVNDNLLKFIQLSIFVVALPMLLFHFLQRSTAKATANLGCILTNQFKPPTRFKINSLTVIN